MAIAGIPIRGLSSGAKPTAAPSGDALAAGSTFYEVDTGRTWFWDGSAWQAGSADAAVLVALWDLAEAVRSMHRTLESMRLGLIETGSAQDVQAPDPDVQLQPV